MFYQSFNVGSNVGEQFNNDIQNSGLHTTCANSDCGVAEITENFFS